MQDSDAEHAWLLQLREVFGRRRVAPQHAAVMAMPRFAVNVDKETRGLFHIECSFFFVRLQLDTCRQHRQLPDIVVEVAPCATQDCATPSRSTAMQQSMRRLKDLQQQRQQHHDNHHHHHYRCGKPAPYGRHQARQLYGCPMRSIKKKK